MKKIILALMAIVALGACSGGEKDLKYRGLSMALPFQTFIDSLTARGFAVDSAKTDSAFTRVVMAKPNEIFRLMLAQKDGQLLALKRTTISLPTIVPVSCGRSCATTLRRSSTHGPICQSMGTITRLRSLRLMAASSRLLLRIPTSPRFRCFTKRRIKALLLCKDRPLLLV